MVITPGKNFDGQKGFPTPSDVPSDTACRSFLLPDNDEWLGLLMGAVELLLNPHNYFNYGDLSIDDTVDHWQTIVQDAYDRSLLGTCAPMVDAPYWDTYGDSDDESSVEDQPWYGELVPVASIGSRRVELLDDDELTWRENLGIWAIAGFIAYSGQIGGAIAFIPFARRFVLKFRGNPLGAIAQIFIDGAKLATLDTASVDERIKAIDIQLPDDDEHEIWVAVSEDSAPGTSLQVIRKELDPAEVYPENLRYDADCDCVQQTYDDGATWVEQPGQDPRTSDTFRYPTIGGGDPQCAAAANMTHFLQDVVETTLANLALGLDALGLATSILPLFVELGPFEILFGLGIGLASGLISLGVDVINEEFTSEVYDQLTCIFYCNIEIDGSVTSEDLAAISSQIDAEMSADVALIMGLMFLLSGPVGLSNEGTIGDAEFDCSSCTSSATGSHTFDLTAAQGEWQASAFAPGNTWALGGWQNNYSVSGEYRASAQISFNIPGCCTIDRIEFTWTGTVRDALINIFHNEDPGIVLQCETGGTPFPTAPFGCDGAFDTPGATTVTFLAQNLTSAGINTLTVTSFTVFFTGNEPSWPS